MSKEEEMAEANARVDSVVAHALALFGARLGDDPSGAAAGACLCACVRVMLADGRVAAVDAVDYLADTVMTVVAAEAARVRRLKTGQS